MEHILISPGKLKLMLTRSDMERYELDGAAMGERDQITRGALKELFSDLRNVVGFDASRDKVFVQMYPSKDGGAEMYITRLGESEKNETESGNVHIDGAAIFDKMSDLLAACAGIALRGVPENSSAWFGDGRYYLLFTENVTYRDYLRGAVSVRIREAIGKLGHVITDRLAAYYVKEHCSCFCESNAVETLGGLA